MKALWPIKQPHLHLLIALPLQVVRAIAALEAGWVSRGLGHMGGEARGSFCRFGPWVPWQGLSRMLAQPASYQKHTPLRAEALLPTHIQWVPLGQLSPSSKALLEPFLREVRGHQVQPPRIPWSPSLTILSPPLQLSFSLTLYPKEVHISLPPVTLSECPGCPVFGHLFLLPVITSYRCEGVSQGPPLGAQVLGQVIQPHLLFPKAKCPYAPVPNCCALEPPCEQTSQWPGSHSLAGLYTVSASMFGSNCTENNLESVWRSFFLLSSAFFLLSTPPQPPSISVCLY